MLFGSMDPMMFKAARDGNVADLFNLLEADPLILERLVTASADTPLHVAAMLGHLDFVKEVIKHKSNVVEYVKELNQQGFSPMHLAAAHGHLDALRVLVEWLWRSKTLVVINSKDGDGNTVLHLAAARKNHQAIELLLSCNDGVPEVLEVNAINKKGLTAMDLLMLCPCESGIVPAEAERLFRGIGAARDRVSDHITSTPRPYHNHNQVSYQKNPLAGHTNIGHTKQRAGGIPSSDFRNAMLVVAILIATATYQAVLSPPGGLQLLDPKSGHGVVAEDRFLRLFFVFLNSAVFHISLYMIVKLIGKSHMQLELFAAIVAMFFTYELLGCL
ncbi:unnamed protein product, partial [Vitis vinifera]